MSDWQRESGMSGTTLDRYITGNYGEDQQGEDDEASEQEYEKRPDGHTLYERMVAEQDGEGYQSHDRCVVLASYYDERDGRMGFVQLATFSGRSGAVPTMTDYRGDVTLQLMSANDEPREMTLSWAALRALCAAADAWEQEHALEYRRPREAR